MGCAWEATRYSPTPSTGMKIAKMPDSFASMPMAATSEKISMKGERTAVRMII